MTGHHVHDHFFRTFDGLMLHCRIFGMPHPRLPVICLPGLSRNGRDFEEIALMLSRDPDRPRQVIALDYRGRGLSDHDDNKANYSVVTEARDVVAMMDHLGMGRAHAIGTSRGGLILHVMATFARERIGAIIFNDIAPKIEAAGMRQIRDYLSAWPQPKSWEQAARALKATHGHGFPVFDDDDWMGMARAIFTDRHGRIEPDYDPALIEPLKSLDLDAPLPDLWPQFALLAENPILSIRGEHSTLIAPETIDAMAKAHGKLRRFTALGQAHAPLLHRHGVDRAVMDFLAEQD